MYTIENVASAPLIPLTKNTLDDFLEEQPSLVKNWVQQTDFKAKPDMFCLIPAEDGSISSVLFGVHEVDANKVETAPIWSIARLSSQLPAQTYHLQCDWDKKSREQAAIGWGLGTYKFGFFKQDFMTKNTPPPILKLDKELEENINKIDAYVDSFTLVRDLVNAPASHMMPEDLSEVMQELAQQYEAEFTEIVGDELLDENYPTIHAVGRASVHNPRFLKMEWGQSSDPLLCLIGKGVCFDTGGLDLKPSKFMRLMKKDMGGAAHVLGLANLIMSLGLKVRLQVLIPAVDNAISANAFRPGDVLDTRSGKSVEVDNTDAEGRLVLCDALTYACENTPDLIIDFATLTGAARVAVGTEIPALFSNKPLLLNEIQQASHGTGELLWSLPMHQPYRSQLDSSVADIMNCSAEGYGGAITAALYLNEFVPENIDWAHIDVMAWNTRDRAGRPKGGEAMGLLAVYRYLDERYG